MKQGVLVVSTVFTSLRILSWLMNFMVEAGFTGDSCNEATKNLEDALGKVTVKAKTSDAFISNQNENLKQFNKESNVTF